MGLSPGAWLDMTPREFDNYRIGYVRRVEGFERTDWSRARYIAWASLTPHAKKGSLETPKDLFEFDWEKDDREKLERKLERAKRYLPKTRKELDSKKWEKVGKRV